MKHIHICKFLLWIIPLALVACQGIVPPPSVPGQKISLPELKDYVVAYCWQDPSGRQSNISPADKEVVIVFESPDGSKRSVARDKYNLPDQHLSDYYIYKSGCIASGDDVRYIGNVLSWRPNSNELTFSEGSSSFLTDFDSRALTKNFVISERDISIIFGDYQKYISEPRGVYWSPDGKKFATLGRDLYIPGSTGDNIWVYDLDEDHYTRITKFNTAGDLIANASWSKNGKKLAVQYGYQSGIGVAQFDTDSPGFKYIEITSLKYSELSDEWPYTFKSIFQLLYDQKNTAFRRYIATTSIPVWINNDEQIIFTASDKSEQGTLFIVNSDGSGLRRLLPEMPGLIFMPTLSPDGKILAFIRYPSWKDQSWVEINTINIISMEMQSLIVLTPSEKKETLLISGMSWSPDGKYLVFSSNHNGESDIYILSADGKNWLNLTEKISGNATSPAWKP